MTIPSALRENLGLPAIAAPMFLASGPDLVVETCRAGMIGAFPALNPRSTEGLEAWLSEIEERLSGTAAAAHAVNLIVHRSNRRLEADLDVVVRKRVPLVITSLGAVPDVVKAVHGYGGCVFHDVINRRHAEKAAEAGVDGIIGVAAGAGGHAGDRSPFALLQEIREVFDGCVVLAGAIGTGRQIAAARVMGADMAYLGTRFLATREAMIAASYKDMIVAAEMSDIQYTDAVSGVSANFLRPSMVQAGLDPDNLVRHGALDMKNEAKAWKTVWSAGHGVGAIQDQPHTADLVASLKAGYAEAMISAAADPFLDG